MLTRRMSFVDPTTLFRNGIDRVVSDLFEAPAIFGLAPERVFPAMNVWEDERNLLVEAELPGLKLDDIEIMVQGDELTLKGERKTEDGDGVSFHRRERGCGAFQRILRLPTRVEVDKVHASLRDGILTITLPKAEDVLPRRITVKGS